jgi:peptidyl-tRNA hydrolase
LKALQKQANAAKLVSAIVRDGGHTQVSKKYYFYVFKIHVYNLYNSGCGRNDDMYRYVISIGKIQIGKITYVCIGIGPAPVSEIDKITGHLKLL